MAKKIKNRVCYAVLDRVTYVNGKWQGADIPKSERNYQNLDSCPLVWDYLNKAGGKGWELVAALQTASQKQGKPSIRTLFLKRKSS